MAKDQHTGHPLGQTALTPADHEAIPLARPQITAEDIAAVNSVLSSGVLSRGSAQIELEEALIRLTGAKHAIAVASGTAGLQLCIEASCPHGSDVITSPFSVPASANAIVAAGSKPCFVDIEEQSLAMNPAHTQSAITGATGALLVVHAFGQPAPMADLAKIARKKDLFLLEDACEAIGAYDQGSALGNQGNAGVFGFYPNKQVTAGEGGVIVCNDDQLAERLRHTRNHGRSESGEWLDQLYPGHNFRLSELAAALVASQLSRLAEILRHRRQLADQYSQRLAGIDDLLRPGLENDKHRSWFVYNIRLLGATAAERDAIIAQMTQQGIHCCHYFAPLHLQPYFQQLLGHVRGDFPVTEKIARESICLPFFNTLNQHQQDRVCRTLREILSSAC